MPNNLWEIVSRINPKDRESCLSLDGELAKHLNSIEDIYSIFYYIPHNRSSELFANTVSKINSIISNHLDNNEEKIQWYRLRGLSNYFDETTKNKIITRWLEDPDDYAVDYINEIIPSNDIILTYLEKLLVLYKKRKSGRNVYIIEQAFKRVPANLLEKACGILYSSTPAVASCLLTRNDINDDYTLKGLKSIAKLKAKHTVQKTIKLEMLKNLGPRSRLDAVKHLLYEMLQGSTPIDPIPTKEELQEFLFPCVLKYNDEVIRAIQEFEYALKNIRR